MSACFLHFSVFSVGGMSIHSNFSTSAAICAIGERGDNRNRVTGEEYERSLRKPNLTIADIVVGFSTYSHITCLPHDDAWSPRARTALRLLNQVLNVPPPLNTA